MNKLSKVLIFPQLTRFNSSAASQFVNRNPRNLERLRIARKPIGYHLDKPGRTFWHKLLITPSSRTVTAEVVHFINGTVVEARTSEWALRKQLYSITDTCAFIALGRVLAQRCLEFGITEVYCDIEATEGGKIDKLLREVENGGVKLEEPHVYRKPNPWDCERPEKPWTVHEE